MFTLKKKYSLIIGMILILVFTASAIAFATSIVENDETFDPTINTTMTDIPWIKQAHTGFDSAFTAARAQDVTGKATDASHIQLVGDTAYLFGYYTNPNSDYIYYRESDSTEKTFSFSMTFLIYPNQAQRWHSLRSVGFLVNCVENSDNTISGYYFSFEQRSGQDKIVIRLLNHVNFLALYSNSVPTDIPRPF